MKARESVIKKIKSLNIKLAQKHLPSQYLKSDVSRYKKGLIESLKYPSELNDKICEYLLELNEYADTSEEIELDTHSAKVKAEYVSVDGFPFMYELDVINDVDDSISDTELERCQCELNQAMFATAISSNLLCEESEIAQKQHLIYCLKNVAEELQVAFR
ncbi:TPA: hypothetical protein RQJ59_001795 [Vibrio vulnificus]|nr:hypothetical protein [Vibrio vulnificus]